MSFKWKKRKFTNSPIHFLVSLNVFELSIVTNFIQNTQI